MLVVKCEEHLSKVKAFAEQRGLVKQLQDKLDYLDTYAGREATECFLYQDFAPYSFEFVMMKGNERWFNGGCIYFGAGDNGVGEPQFSVRIGDSSEGWSIHT